MLHTHLVLSSQLILETLLNLFGLLPFLSTLEVNVLRDKTRSEGLSHKRRVLALVRGLVDEKTNLTDIVHDHILELDISHIAFFVV